MSAFRPSSYTLPVSPESVQADHPGFSFEIFHDPPGQVWADFVHDVDEFVVVAAGRIDIEVGAERAECSPGDLVQIPAGTPHTLRTASDKGSIWYYGYGRFEGRANA
jgi:cupin 2 domain-containing protein